MRMREAEALLREVLTWLDTGEFDDGSEVSCPVNSIEPTGLSDRIRAALFADDAQPRQIAMLFGKPLPEASEEEVRRTIQHAHKTLMGMRIPDAKIEANWVDTIGSLQAELQRRELPIETLS